MNTKIFASVPSINYVIILDETKNNTNRVGTFCVNFTHIQYLQHVNRLQKLSDNYKTKIILTCIYITTTFPIVLFICLEIGRKGKKICNHGNSHFKSKPALNRAPWFHFSFHNISGTKQNMSTVILSYYYLTNLFLSS